MTNSFDEFDKEFDKEFNIEDGDRSSHEYDNSNSGDFDDFYDEDELKEAVSEEIEASSDDTEIEAEKPARRKIGRDVRRVEFDMKMEKKDYLNLVMYSIMGKNRFAAFGVFAILVICAGYLILGGIGAIEMTGILKLVAVALILIVIILLILMNYIRRKLEVSDLAYMGRNRHMIICEDMVISETDDEDTTREFEWEGLYNGEECKTYFLMYSNTGMIVFLPKRFMTEEQIPQIRKILKVMMQSKFRTKYKVN